MDSDHIREYNHCDHDQLTPEEFVAAARKFVAISYNICDGWTMHENNVDLHKTYVRKKLYLKDCGAGLLKAEFVVFYNLSYGVPAFSFNIWDSSGVLLTLEDIRQMSFIKISLKDFYSVITQQEHPLFLRPYFIMHPCHTSDLISAFRRKSKNIIATFLGLITPIIKLDLPMEYGL